VTGVTTADLADWTKLGLSQVVKEMHILVEDAVNRRFPYPGLRKLDAFPSLRKVVVLEVNGSSKDLSSWPLCSLDEIELRECFLDLGEEDFDVIRGLLASPRIKITLEPDFEVMADHLSEDPEIMLWWQRECTFWKSLAPRVTLLINEHGFGFD